ncbi:zinc-ribbon domain-containing protein [Bifidobacterium longum]
MVYCTECGFANEQGNAFCSQCGSPFGAARGQSGGPCL